MSTRGMTSDKLLLPWSSTCLQYKESGMSLVSVIAYFLSLKARNFQPICKILVKIRLFENLRDGVMFP